ncbi:hypothetical protein PQX77_010922 [Marasmius sp. AFHP31]|nr:hypothetical protein PQX77_010922 [Marasmius sp. AFHP31]
MPRVLVSLGFLPTMGSHPGIATMRLPYDQITHYQWRGGDNRVEIDRRTSHFLLQHRVLYANSVELNSCQLILDRETIALYNRLTTMPRALSGLHLTLNITKFALLSVDHQSSVEAVLEFIDLPSLESLTILSSGVDQNPLLRSLIHPERLFSLTIHHVKMPPTVFEAVLSRLTSLKALSFGVDGDGDNDDGGITDDYLSLFCSGTNGIVPHLQDLVFISHPGFESSYTDERLLDMLEARWIASTPDVGSVHPGLCSATVDREIENPSAVQRLDRILAQGFRLVVRGN